MRDWQKEISDVVSFIKRCEYNRGYRACADELATEIKAMKNRQDCSNADYRTGFISALSSLDGYIAQMEGSDADSD